MVKRRLICMRSQHPPGRTAGSSKLHVFVSRQNPGDRVQVDAVFGGQDAAHPDAGGKRVAAYANLAAFEILRRPDTAAPVAQQLAVIEGAGQEDGDSGKALAVGAGTETGRQRHLRDIELEPPHHAAEYHRHGGDLNVLQVEHRGGDGAILQGRGMAIVSYRGTQHRTGLLFHAPTPICMVARPGRTFPADRFDRFGVLDGCRARGRMAAWYADEARSHSPPQPPVSRER